MAKGARLVGNEEGYFLGNWNAAMVFVLLQAELGTTPLRAAHSFFFSVQFEHLFRETSNVSTVDSKVADTYCLGRERGNNKSVFCVYRLKKIKGVFSTLYLSNLLWLYCFNCCVVGLHKIPFTTNWENLTNTADNTVYTSQLACRSLVF